MGSEAFTQLFVDDLGNPREGKGVEGNFGAHPVVGVGVVVAPADHHVGLKLRVQACERETFGAVAGHARVAHVEEVVLRAELRGDPRAVLLPDAPDLGVFGIAELTRQLAVSRPDEHYLVAARRVFGERTDAAQLVVGVGKNSHDVHMELV